MATMEMTRPVELIPPRRQTLWGWPAVLNFALGGLGAGLYVVAVLAAGFGQSPAVTLASWLGPALLLAAADLTFPLRLHRVQAVVAALLLALAQGFILRRARGITAWDVSLMPFLFLISALLSGSGLYLMIEVAAGRLPGAPLVSVVLVLLGAGLAAWVWYLRWSSEPAFVQAVGSLGQGRASLLIVGGGYVAPFVLAALAVGLPRLALPALPVAGALMIGAQLYAKALLILTAGRFRPITLAALRVQRRSS